MKASQNKGEIDYSYGSYHRASMPDFSLSALISQVVTMRFQGVGLCLGLLVITVNAELVNGVEVEDFSENSEESNSKEDEPSSGVRRLRCEL